MLALGMVAYPGGFSKAGQTQHGLDTLKWGSDYLLASYLGTSGNSTSYVAQASEYPSLQIYQLCLCLGKTPGLTFACLVKNQV